MGDLKITDVPQGSSVGAADEFYIKTGSNFRRVSVSELLTLLNTQGFYQKNLDGIPTTDLAAKMVYITEDEGEYYSNMTCSQIAAAEEGGFAIHPVFVSDNTYLRGVVLDIYDSCALLAFLVPGSGPHISIFHVTDLSVTETRIPICGQPCRAVCNTEAGTTAKTAAVQGAASNLFSLYDGATVYVFFTNAVAPGSTLNVNDTGAKQIDFCGSAGIPAGTYAQLFYHEALGTWILLGGGAGGGSGGSGLTSDVKEALLACFANVEWVAGDGQDYYDALEEALLPSAALASISAVFTQGGNEVFADETLDSLRPMLVVTALYEDQSTDTITNYTLSGTLAVGVSTVTVSYKDKTTTFNVVVTERLIPADYQRCEYIEATGTQYIDTGVMITSETPKFELEYYIASLPDREKYFVNCYTGNPPANYTNKVQIGVSTVANRIYAYSSSSASVVDPIVFASKNNLIAEFRVSSPYCTLTVTDGDTTATGSKTTQNNSPLTGAKITLFADAYTDHNGISGRLYHARVEDGAGDAILDAYPCYHKTTGDIGMYDTVTAQFMGNSGSGAFLKGDDI